MTYVNLYGVVSVGHLTPGEISLQNFPEYSVLHVHLLPPSRER